MTQHTLEQLVEPQKAAVAARTAAHEEAVALLADLRSITSDDPAFNVSQRQLPDAELAEHVTRADLEDARRDLTAAYAAGRREIVEQHRADLAADVATVDKALNTLLAAVARLDARREALVGQLAGASELVPIVTWPYLSERVTSWRETMRSENLL